MARRTVFIIPSGEIGWAAVRATVAGLDDTAIVGEATGVLRAKQLLATLPREPDLILSAARVTGVPVAPLLRRLRRAGGMTARVAIFAPRFDDDDRRAFAAIGGVSCIRWGDLGRPTLAHCLAMLSHSDVVITSPEGPVPKA